MANIKAFEDVLEMAGVHSLAGLADPAKRPWRYVINYDDAIADGASQEKQILTDNGTIFILRQVHVHLRQSSNNRPLALESGPTDSTNTEVWLDNVRVSLRTNTQDWMSDPDGVPASEFAVKPGCPVSGHAHTP